MTDAVERRAPAGGSVAARSVAARSRLGPWTLAVLTPLIGLALGLVIWQGLSAWIGANTFPAPATVFTTLRENLVESTYLEGIGLSSGGYLPHIFYTMRNVFVGLGLGALFGISLGLLSIPIPSIGEVVDTVAVPVVVSPVVVAAPFFLIWFGVVAGAQILIITFYSTFLLYIYSRRAGRNVRPQYVESALTLGATRWLIFRQVYVPATVPEIAGAVRIALAGAWGLEAIAELLGAQQGVGFLIQFYSGAFQIDGMLALVLLLGVVAIIIDRTIVLVIRYITRWSEAGQTLHL